MVAGRLSIRAGRRFAALGVGALVLLASLPAARHRRPGARSCASRFRPRKRGSTRSASPICTRTPSTRRSSSACSPTTTWRAPPSSCRWWPRRCPRSKDERPRLHLPPAQGDPLHARSGVQGRRSASSSPRTSSTRTSGSWTRRTARRGRSCSKARSRAWTSSPTRRRRSGKFDYDAKVAGMRAVDRYTLEFRLKATDYNFPFVVAHVPFGAVAREVVEAYGDDIAAHPVGTGPYVLKQWTRGRRSCWRPTPTTAASPGTSSPPSPPGTTRWSRR